MKSVLITGASSGIGEAAAKRLDAMGWRVFASVRCEEDGERLKHDTSGLLMPIMIDLTQPELIQSGIDQIRQIVGENGLSGLVNNAGIAVFGPIEVLPMAQIREQFDVNLFGHIALTQACLPLLRQGRGRIINVGSILGRFVAPFSSPYCMSKFAMGAFTDALRLEVSRWGIRAISIEPGVISTPTWGKTLESTFAMTHQLPVDAQHLYSDALNKFCTTLEKASQQGTPPEVVVNAIIHALTARWTKTHYLPGHHALLLAILRWSLPDRVMDWGLKWRYGVR